MILMYVKARKFKVKHPWWLGESKHQNKIWTWKVVMVMFFKLIWKKYQKSFLPKAVIVSIKKKKKRERKFYGQKKKIVTKCLSKSIMVRFKLKILYLKNKTESNLKSYKKQMNVWTILFCKTNSFFLKYWHQSIYW